MKPACEGEAWPLAPGEEVGCAEASCWRCRCGVRERDESGESGAWYALVLAGHAEPDACDGEERAEGSMLRA